MKPASLKDIKQELSLLPHKELVQLFTTVIKYRKENKELITYLLFESKDEVAFIKNAKAEMEELLQPVNRFNVNTSIKYIRSILRNTKKIIRFTGRKDIEVELLLHFLSLIKSKSLPLKRNKALLKIWERTILNVGKAISSLHEDLVHDYQVELANLIED